VAVGAGLVLLVTNLLALSWEHVYVFPYSYPMLHMINRFPDINLAAWSGGWTILLLTVAYVLYIKKADKG
jgi:hypothetical protein